MRDIISLIHDEFTAGSMPTANRPLRRSIVFDDSGIVTDDILARPSFMSGRSHQELLIP